jgi:hypothetical protein
MEVPTKIGDGPRRQKKIAMGVWKRKEREGRGLLSHSSFQYLSEPFFPDNSDCPSPNNPVDMIPSVFMQ